jgi:transcriptional regulator with XRE-family HTH domain
MSNYAPCALRTHRRTWGLSQRELADILGYESATQVSRLEHGKRTPLLETALACSTLFGVSLDELFPQLATEIEEKLRKKISRLREGSFHTTTPLEVRKQELLDRALSRVADEHQVKEYEA